MGDRGRNGLAETGWDFNAAVRVCVWSAITLGALSLAALAALPEQLGSAPTAKLFAQARALLPARSLATAGDPEAVQRLQSSLLALAAERERLVARIEALERSLETTGSVRRDGAIAVRPLQGLPEGAAGSGAELKNEPKKAAEALEASSRSAAATADLGVDLGPGNSVETIRSLWLTLRGNHGPLLDGMRPLLAVREGRKPGLVELRLVVGPVANSAQAQQVCAMLAGAGQPCQAAPFEGQRLAFR